MNTGCDYGCRQGRNGKSCVTVGPVTGTAGRLAFSQLKVLAVDRAGHPADVRCMPATLAGSKHCKGDELPCNGPYLSMYVVCQLNPRRLKALQRGWAPLQRTLPVYVRCMPAQPSPAQSIAKGMRSLATDLTCLCESSASSSVAVCFSLSQERGFVYRNFGRMISWQLSQGC